MPHSEIPPLANETAKTTKPKFVLSRVEEQDFDELLVVQYESFKTVDMHQALFGPNTKENRDKLKKHFIEDMHNDVADCWLKLVDTTTGKIVSASQWKIYSSWKEIKPAKFTIDCYEGEEKECAEMLGQQFMDRRAKHMYGHPHVLLYILFTDPSYQRSGAGSIHVKWGTDLADRLLLPAWVEGSPHGHHLYESYGFKDVEYVHTPTKYAVSEYTVMRREPKTHFDIGRTITYQ